MIIDFVFIRYAGSIENYIVELQTLVEGKLTTHKKFYFEKIRDAVTFATEKQIENKCADNILNFLIELIEDEEKGSSGYFYFNPDNTITAWISEETEAYHKKYYRNED